MEKLILNMVQAQIGHQFKNLDLLCQAFTRRSYSEENGGENNEVLEFIGDKALDIAVVRLLISKFGKMKNGDPVDEIKNGAKRIKMFSQNSSDAFDGVNEFVCQYDEGELTKIKSRMVEKRNLAQRMDEMGFSEHLRMGNSDIKNGVGDEPSVKEDLFEAIIGAVTLDCKWDFDVIQSVVDAMLVPEDFFTNDKDDNYVRMIYDWEAQEHNCIPLFWFKKLPHPSVCPLPFIGITHHLPPNYDIFKIQFHCELKLLNDLPIFRGFGESKSEARMNACEAAYDYLCREGYIYETSIQDEIENPNKDDSIGQLEILARRGYFSIPTYEYKQEYDSNGNPIWTCRCHIKEIEKVFESTSSSKKDAKKTAAFEMLEYVLSEEDE